MKDSLHTDKKFKYDVFQINNVFSAIREINSQMIREDNEEKLLKQACEILKNKVGYDLVYVALANQAQTKIEKVYSSESTEPLIKFNGFYCYNEIVQMQTKQLFNPSINCFDCYLKDNYKNQDRLVIPVKFQHHFYGMICIIIPQDYKLYVKEQDLLETLAEDIAYTLFNLEVRRDHAKIRKEVAAYYNQVEEQNEQLRQKNYQLEIANKKACESDILKDSFLGMVSHELRTPLNGILGFTQLLQSSKIPVEKAGDFIDVIHQSGIQLLQVVNNLLDISKIQAKQLTYHENEFYVNDLFNDVVDANQFFIDKSEKVDFIVQNQLSQDMNISADYEKLKQILNVLVSNAIKFTRKGTVEVGCTRPGKNKLLFYVKDTGIGIEKEKSSIIFQTFRQSDESRTRKYGGTGLGLSIAKGLVNFLKGKIWFESEINQGSIFYFMIPVLINQSLEDNFNQNEMKENNIPDWSDKNILIVEDDPFSSDYLVEALSETRVHTTVVSNGEEAVRLLKNQDDFDVVLMDIQLPGLSGDDATKQIRAFNNNTPIIAQTANAMVSDRGKYINAGCTDYISKPIAVDDLFSILCNYI